MKPCQDEISHGALSHSHSETGQNEAGVFVKLQLNETDNLGQVAGAINQDMTFYYKLLNYHSALKNNLQLQLNTHHYTLP
jgi:hypothetical protein